jgi:cell division protein FtsL
VIGRLNSLLLGTLVVCALSVVTSQHQSRKLFIELEKEQDTARKLDQEWRELQIESQTLATSKRIEQKAVRDLGMRVPEAGKSIVVVLDADVSTPAPAQGQPAEVK